MGIRFRKSVKIAPGIKVNFGKKSVGMSIGGKYGGMSFNSKNGARVRSSIPGTGLSYSAKISGSNKSKSQSGNSATNNKPVCLRWWYILLIVLIAIGGFGNIGANTGAAIFGIGIAAIMGFITFKTAKSNLHNKTEEENASEQSQE